MPICGCWKYCAGIISHGLTRIDTERNIRVSSVANESAMGELIHKGITGEIIGAAFEVYNVLGYGFLEKVYENALIRELQIGGLHAVAQYPIKINYKDTEVGDYYADILVESKVIVELKTGESFNPIHEAQLLNYLKATGIKVGLLINFGPDKCEYRRLVY